MAGLGDIDRRSFLRAHLTAESFLPRPPWSSEEAVRSACTGCGRCVEVCPQRIVRLDRRNQAFLDFMQAECTFCGLCRDACEEEVFDRAAQIPFPNMAKIGEECLAARGIVCRSCGDACPEEAIRFAMRRGGPSLPSLDAERCTGCGACLGTCPADAIAMIARESEAHHG